MRKNKGTVKKEDRFGDNVASYFSRDRDDCSVVGPWQLLKAIKAALPLRQLVQQRHVRLGFFRCAWPDTVPCQRCAPVAPNLWTTLPPCPPCLKCRSSFR